MYHLNIRTLEYLYSIEKYGSLRKAARMLSVDPAAISRALSQLEQIIGVRIWERKSRNSCLTEPGRELVYYYKSILRGEVAVMQKLTQLKEFKKGHVSIAIGEGFISNFVSKPMQSFMVRHPGINLSLEIAGALDAVKMLEDQQVDFAITYASAPHSKLQTHIERTHPLELIAPKGHSLAAGQRPVTLEEIKESSLALIDSSTGMGRLVKHVENISHIKLEPKTTDKLSKRAH
ncbi:transcriptional regulator LysR family [Vibrio variabilis]|uniref:Transcriptional regulator LysR family n=1 Tax=Vibrio variabilis TaxID=990271 RepID=A0ABQ0J7M6_9VIBR|nr:transcriptional regulator LysR family [Vibrio variabilis]